MTQLPLPSSEGKACSKEIKILGTVASELSQIRRTPSGVVYLEKGVYPVHSPAPIRLTRDHVVLTQDDILRLEVQDQKVLARCSSTNSRAERLPSKRIRDC